MSSRTPGGERIPQDEDHCSRQSAQRWRRALHVSRILPPENTFGTHFLLGAESTPGL
jgi:hypothetical protein